MEHALRSGRGRFVVGDFFDLGQVVRYFLHEIRDARALAHARFHDHASVGEDFFELDGTEAHHADRLVRALVAAQGFGEGSFAGVHLVHETFHVADRHRDVPLDAVLDHLAVAGLEHVQRNDLSRKRHAIGNRKYRDGHESLPHPRALQIPLPDLKAFR
ncbi:hypothetical protein IPQ45_22435 [Xanthomonas perforans]|nr:hypothetical protein [Xanthomonas perforans]